MASQSENRLEVTQDPTPVKDVKSSYEFKPHTYGSIPFGINYPFFVQDLLPEQKESYIGSNVLRSGNLASPLLQKFGMFRDFFSVPLSAICPLNKDLLVTQPAATSATESSFPHFVGATQDCYKAIAPNFDFAQCVHLLYYEYSTRIYHLWDRCSTTATPSVPTRTLAVRTMFAVLVNYLITFERFFSRGSLLQQLGFGSSSWYRMARYSGDNWTDSELAPFDEFTDGGNDVDFDNAFDKFFAHIFSLMDFSQSDTYLEVSMGSPYITQNTTHLFDFDIKGTYRVVPTKDYYKNTDTNYQYITFREFLYMLRDGGTYPYYIDIVNGGEYITNVVFDTSSSNCVPWYFLHNCLFIMTDFDKHMFRQSGVENRIMMEMTVLHNNDVLTLDISRPIAYQMVNARFYSDSQVDAVTSANLWRQNLSALLSNFHENSYVSGDVAVSTPMFEHLGIRLPFDVCSMQFTCGWFNSLYTMRNLFPADVEEDLHAFWASFTAFDSMLALLFGTKRSMRFKDQYAGARPKAYGVGNLYVDASNNSVSVVDVTKGIQLQRLLNAVQKAGNKAIDQIRSLHPSVKIVPDITEPSWLFQYRCEVGNAETDNTADAQQNKLFSTTSQLIAHDSPTHSIDIECPQYPTILIGICWFDLTRVAWKQRDGVLALTDRYDKFIPQMQYIGDEALPYGQLEQFQGMHSALSGLPVTFGYQSRYMPYKVIQDISSGALAGGSLSHWLFLLDRNRNVPEHIDSGYIRSVPSEFDSYFNLATGYSLGNYFHFVVRFDHNVKSLSPVVKHPKIL